MIERSSSSIKVEVSSTPTTATLNIGNSKFFDLDEDGIYDLSVTFDKIIANKASITFMKITQPVTTALCIEDWTCNNWIECTTQGTRTRTCTDLNNCGTTTNKPTESGTCKYSPQIQGEAVRESPEEMNYVWWIVAIVVIAGIVYFIKRKKRN